MADLSEQERFRAIHKAVCDPGASTKRSVMPGPGTPWESLSHWQTRAVMEVIGPWLAETSAADLMKWLHAEAADMEARSAEGLPAGTPVLEGQRAVQAQLAKSLTAAIAHIAVMKPEIPHA